MDELMRVENLTTAELYRAAEILKGGGLVAIPTETVYGLAANALDPRAVSRIFAAKDRPFFDPLIVHLADVDWWPRVVSEFPPLARRLAERFWPGPLTLILPKSNAVPDLVTSGMPTVGIRIPDHPLTQQLLRMADIPVAAPSANPFGRLSPTTAEHVRQQLGDRIEMILDGGSCRVGIESTILQIHGDAVTLLRPGGIDLESIEALIGPVGRPSPSAQNQPAAPGMLDSHYAPRTKLSLVDQIPHQAPSASVGALVFTEESNLSGYAAIETLSSSVDLVEAAAGFFQALHRLDQGGLELILACPFPDQGLGRALNDRLRRAAHG
ncbi:MAG: threonylcarbamoyl-AMP synthase [Planctomycetes bacterium]|nr:threonylcarbamoyl-AMP synthase [Planctomycetota bacterium]